MEYDNGLMLACGIELKGEYLEAAARDLRAIIQLLEIHGEIFFLLAFGFIQKSQQ